MADARRSGIEVISENIEHESDLVEPLDYDIRLGQDYLFGEPRPSHEAA